MITMADIKSEEKFYREITDIFIEYYISNKTGYKYEYESQPDKENRSLKAPDFKYVNSKNNKAIVIEISRIVCTNLNNKIMLDKLYNEALKKVQAEIPGTYLLLIDEKEHRKFNKRNKRMQYAQEILHQIIPKISYIKIGKSIKNGPVRLFKINNENSKIIVQVIRSYSNPDGKPSDIVSIIEESAKKFKNYISDNTQSILLILKNTDVIGYGNTGLLIREIIGGLYVDLIFDKKVINEVCEINFDDDWNSDITLNVCYPDSKSLSLIPKNVLFDSAKTYNKFIASFFPK